MKLDPTKPILDLDGKVAREDIVEAIKDATGRVVGQRVTGERDLTLALVAERALSVQKQRSGAEQYDCFKLALVLHQATGEISITTEQASLIKKAVEEANYSPIVYGRVRDIVESAEAAGQAPA